jgi:hypothetical protein
MPKPPRQTLLKPNRRALAIGGLTPALVAIVCLGVMFVSRPDSTLGVVGFAVGGLFLVFSLAMLIGLAIMAFVPRVALTPDHMLVYLRGYQPYRVPLEVVECFFQGQGTAALKTPAEARSTNVVVRLAERARDWHNRPVKRSLGEWKDGYITIRGTWCEPITETKLRSLNSDLARVKRQQKARPRADG